MHEEKQLIAAMVITLRNMDNLILAAANNALNGFGRIAQGNIAYEQFKDFSLIREDGSPKGGDVLLDALAFVINERIENGSFV